MYTIIDPREEIMPKNGLRMNPDSLWFIKFSENMFISLEKITLILEKTAVSFFTPYKNHKATEKCT